MTTCAEHMPGSHQHKMVTGTIAGLRASIGHATHQVVTLCCNPEHTRNRHTEVAEGLLGLSRKYSEQRLEQACCDALLVQKIHYQFIKTYC